MALLKQISLDHRNSLCPIRTAMAGLWVGVWRDHFKFRWLNESVVASCSNRTWQARLTFFVGRIDHLFRDNQETEQCNAKTRLQVACTPLCPSGRQELSLQMQSLMLVMPAFLRRRVDCGHDLQLCWPDSFCHASPPSTCSAIDGIRNCKFENGKLDYIAVGTLRRSKVLSKHSWQAQFAT